MSSILTLNHAGKELEAYRENAFYPTPWEATEALMVAEEQFLIDYTSVDEPACGDGAMAEVIRGHEKKVMASDLIWRGYGMGSRDFLSINNRRHSDCLITNPPFPLAADFIKQSHRLGYSYIAMLLKSNFFHAKKHNRLRQMHPPARIRPCGWRIDFTGKGRNHFDCIWVVWEPGRNEPTEYCETLIKPKHLKQPKLF